MKTKVMTNVLHALGGYDPDNLDQDFFNEEVSENTIDDEGKDTDFLDIPHFSQSGRESDSDDDAEIAIIPAWGNQVENCMVVDLQNTTSEVQDTLRPSELDATSEKNDVDAVDQF